MKKTVLIYFIIVFFLPICSFAETKFIFNCNQAILSSNEAFQLKDLPEQKVISPPDGSPDFDDTIYQRGQSDQKAFLILGKAGLSFQGDTMTTEITGGMGKLYDRPMKALCYVGDIAFFYNLSDGAGLGLHGGPMLMHPVWDNPLYGEEEYGYLGGLLLRFKYFGINIDYFSMEFTVKDASRVSIPDSMTLDLTGVLLSTSFNFSF